LITSTNDEITTIIHHPLTVDSIIDYSMLGRYKPSSLRGKPEKTQYFEGWFQKVYSKKHQASCIIIYGYATHNSYDTCGFIQILTPHSPPDILYFPKHEISFDHDRHIVRMADNMFTTKEIIISIQDIDINLNLVNNHPIPTFKNSMGYTYYIPNLPCYHSVMNTAHQVTGNIRNKNAEYSFDQDMGYMEKNWGTSFPESYFWLHAIDPYNADVSILFSIAEIQWLGKSFIKHVGHLRIEGKHIDLRTLKDISISDKIISEKKRCVNFRSKELELDIWITYGKKVTFKAPNQGNMSRDISHHTDALIAICIKHNGKTRMHRLIGNFEHIGSPFI